MALTQSAVAGELGVTQSTVSFWEGARGGQIPTPDLMVAIYRLTRGAVAPNDFYDLPDLDQMTLPIEAGPAPLLEAAR